MPADERFLSFAPNAVDVVLWRALRQVTDGRFVEAWADRPASPSVGAALRRRGWRGVVVEPPPATDSPDPSGAAAEDAPGEIVIRARLLGDGPDVRPLDALLDERLAPQDDIHAMVLWGEGAQEGVLAGLDLRRRRPWVLVVEGTPATGAGTAPDRDARVRDAGYEHVLFDGRSHVYVAREHAATLGPALGVPAHPGDDFVPVTVERLEEELAATRAELDRLRTAHDEALAELDHWRGTVLSRWTAALEGGGGGRERRPGHEVVQLREELAATHATLSWRITAPLRAVQRRRLQGWR